MSQQLCTLYSFLNRLSRELLINFWLSEHSHLWNQTIYFRGGRVKSWLYAVLEKGKKKKMVKQVDLDKLWIRGTDPLSVDRAVQRFTAFRTEPTFLQWKIPTDLSSSGPAHDNPQTAEAGPCYQLGWSCPLGAISRNCLKWIPEN